MTTGRHATVTPSLTARKPFSGPPVGLRVQIARSTREKGAGATADAAGDEANEHVVASAAGPSNDTVDEVKQEDASSLLNGTDDLECSEQTEESNCISMHPQSVSL
ncbi:hypothetical protein MTO96_023474 [Rhipicephalus appendiculatus]